MADEDNPGYPAGQAPTGADRATAPPPDVVQLFCDGCRTWQPMSGHLCLGGIDDY